MTDETKISARTVLTDPVHLLAFGLGLGLSPVAPGTVGTLLGVVIAWLTLADVFQSIVWFAGLFLSESNT